ncbi:PLP-dependent aminotransferase family protein [Gudongella sp. DL1XJH-153]|uniref:MocR-like pyridoxine biosynthesis transcription factor PdxR n=1 Tax=Gudongella sp. DL1XJH-153 TaxID=3409804 RepID=UPI003BB6A305
MYIQLYEAIRDVIEDDNIQSEKLPSIRSLSKQLGVNNVTVVNAYKLLEQENYIYTVKGSGTFIKRPSFSQDSYLVEEGDMELMLSGIYPLLKNSIDFASVSPTAELFPIEEFKKSLIEVLDRDGGQAFLYPEITGFGPLRESISEFLLEHYSISATKDQILITSGGQQGLDIISKTLIQPGDVILVENPTYPGAFAAFQSRGAKIIGIPMDEDGIDLDGLKSYVKRYRPKFIYLMPNFHSPTTICYSETRKKDVLRLAREYGFYIIEDDFLTDLSFSDDNKLPLKTMDKFDQVIFIKSFSKIFMPGVRIGFMTLPKALMKDIIKAKHTTDISSSGYLQRAFDLYLRKGFWRDHIENITAFYRDRYQLMISGLAKLKHFGISYLEPVGGLSIWVSLPKEFDAIELYEECGKRGLAIVPGKVFFTDSSDSEKFIRLSFSAVGEKEINKGLGILEDILSKSENEPSEKYMPFL